ncbi:MAG: hypothetical protein AAFY56_07710 [Pseudomonadota bacterium]
MRIEIALGFSSSRIFRDAHSMSSRAGVGGVRAEANEFITDNTNVHYVG